ncbi:glycosyltransferase [bacterium]|nr:glycosyltransferase [bacterium]
MTDLTVTAIIPSYGRPDSLARCLDGLLHGERLPDEVVVVVRETDAATREAAEAYPTVRIATVTEPGQIAAMNAGLAVATGEIVCFPDDDCVPRTDWLRRLMAHYDDPQVGGVGGRDVVGGPEGPEPPLVGRVGVVTWYGRIIGSHHCRTTPEPRPVDHLKGVNMSFRRVLLPAFDGRIRGPHLNDTDISLGVRRRGYRLIFDPDAKVDHYPAVRPDTPGGRDLLDPQLAYLDAHDRMYVLLKHTSALRKPLVVAYQLLLGTRVQPGVLTALAVGRWRVVGACVAGGLAGIGTALRAGCPRSQ